MFVFTSTMAMKSPYAPPPYHTDSNVHQTPTGHYPVAMAAGYHSVPSAPAEVDTERRGTPARRSTHIVLITLIVAITIVLLTLIITGAVIFLRHHPGPATPAATTTTTPRPSKVHRTNKPAILRNDCLASFLFF